MMKKSPLQRGGGLLVGGIKVIVALELVGVGITYYFWKRMNSSQDYRYKMYKSYPSILNGYYVIGERFGGLDTRTEDYRTWGVAVRDKS